MVSKILGNFSSKTVWLVFKFPCISDGFMEYLSSVFHSVMLIFHLHNNKPIILKNIWGHFTLFWLTAASHYMFPRHSWVTLSTLLLPSALWKALGMSVLTHVSMISGYSKFPSFLAYFLIFQAHCKRAHCF